MVMVINVSFTSFDFPLLHLGNSTDAWPAVLLNTCEVFDTFNISRSILSFILGGFFACWVSAVYISLAAKLSSVIADG